LSKYYPHRIASALESLKIAAIQSSDDLWSTQHLKGNGIVANVGSDQGPWSDLAGHGPEPQMRKEWKMLSIFVVEFLGQLP